VMGDLAIAYTAQPGNAAVTLRAIRLADGTEAWSVPLGTAQMVYNARGSQVVPVPRLIAQREMLYIMTNNGGLLAFDTEARQLSWALRYEIPGGAALVNQHRGYNTTNVTLPHAGDLLIANGLVLVKEARSREMRAIDLGTRQVAWERPLSTHARLAAQDEKRFYFFDPQLVAIDKGNEQRMKWSVQLPKGSSSTGLVDLGDSFAVFTSRGVFAYSKANGDRVHKFPGHDRDSWGGDVFVHDGKLITVSNQAITAYPLSPAVAEAKEAQP